MVISQISIAQAPPPTPASGEKGGNPDNLICPYSPDLILEIPVLEQDRIVGGGFHPT